MGKQVAASAERKQAGRLFIYAGLPVIRAPGRSRETERLWGSGFSDGW